MLNGNASDRLQEFRRLFASLSVDEKIEFFEQELKDSGLTVIFGGSNRVTSEVCINIYNAKDLEVDKVLETVASYITAN